MGSHKGKISDDDVFTPQTPLVVAGTSTGVPTVAAPSAVASTHGAALLAMMVQNPTTPLGALPTQPLLQSYPHTLPADECFKREKTALPKLAVKAADSPKGPFCTKNTTALESVVFCYGRTFDFPYRFSASFPWENQHF